MISKAEQVKCDAKSKKPTYETTSIQYDVSGNLKQYGKVSYKIDPLNKRLSRSVNGIVTNMYAYNPEGQMIAELDGSGSLKKYFIYGSKNHVPDYFIDSNNNRFKIVVDHLGSVRIVINSQTGEVKEKMNHDEFGKVLQNTNPNYIPFGFAGGIYDSETKLVRFGVRDYDAKVGRWTSKDPIRFEGGETSLYGYALNDPINLIDVNGQNAVLPVLVVGGTVWLGVYFYNQYNYYVSGDYIKEQIKHPPRDPSKITTPDLNDLQNGCPVPNNNYTPKGGPLPPMLKQFGGV